MSNNDVQGGFPLEFFKNLFEEPSITDWIQAIGSIVAVFVAFVSLIVSKRTLDTGVRTYLRITRAYFNLEVSSDTVFQVSLHNPGRFDAYEIKVYGYFLENTKIFGLKRFRDVKKCELSGPLEINAGEMKQYVRTQEKSFSFDVTNPIIVTYELASGSVIKSFWMFNSNRTGIEDRFIKISRFNIWKYKIRRFTANIRHLIITLMFAYEKKKQSRSK